MMDLSLISLIVLAVVVAIGFIKIVNIGFFSIGAAFLLGSYGQMSAKQIAAGFSSSMFVTLVGVTFLFGMASANGTLNLFSKKVVALVGKRTPEMVLEFIAALDLRPAPKAWLEFVRADVAETFDGAEGVLFFAAPDALAGLVTWATFDNNAADAVASPFGSGCSSVVAQAVQENRNGGRRCFLGLFDPSVRPWVEPDVLSFVVPMSRFREMCGMMRASCLFDTHAWSKVRERINNDN